MTPQKGKNLGQAEKSVERLRTEAACTSGVNLTLLIAFA
jgi:hypothetical protein